MGSSGYMAPECYHGVELDQRVDLFACGVLLYELLTGRRPVKGVPGAVMHQLLHSDPPPLAGPDCSAAEAAALAPFEPIVARAMARDRSQRYPGAQEMLDALSAVAGQPIAPRVSVAAVQCLIAPRAVATAAATTLPPPHQTQPPKPPVRIHMLPRKPQPIHVRTDAPPQLEAAAPAPPTVPPTPPSPPAFDPAALAALTALLVPTFGPVARVLVQRVAAKTQSPAALVASLASQLPADARRRFVADAQSAVGRTDVDAVVTLPVLGSTPLCDDAVQRAERALTRHIGPIARVLVKSARAKASHREQFIAALADLAADCIDPQRLLAELEKTV
jgi:hypothetical protein